MEWQDEAIVLGVRRHGETSVVAELMTRRHGRHMGLVRSGRSRAMQPVLQPGNAVDATWRARLSEHLGDFRLEPTHLRAAGLMEKALSVYGVQALASLLRLLPERDPHPHLYEALGVVLDHLTEPAVAGELFVRFELAVLNDLGFGLDLTECAATGRRDDLVYVSPKSGRAVCRVAGEPYAPRLLALPDFLNGAQSDVRPATGAALSDAFRLTGFFLTRNVYEPRAATGGSVRDSFIQAVLKGCDAAGAPAAAE